MYSRLKFVSKIKPDSLLEVQTFNNKQFFYKSDLFSGFCIRKKNQEISVFRKLGEQKLGVSGHEWIFPQTNVKLNFLLIFCISCIKSI